MESAAHVPLLPETLAFVERLRAQPFSPVTCVFKCQGEGNGAIMLRQMSAGCVALRNTHVQALCLQHEMDRTPINDGPEGDLAVADLSLDGQFSQQIGVEPLYVIMRGVGLVPYTEADLPKQPL